MSPSLAACSWQKLYLFSSILVHNFHFFVCLFLHLTVCVLSLWPWSKFLLSRRYNWKPYVYFPLKKIIGYGKDKFENNVWSISNTKESSRNFETGYFDNFFLQNLLIKYIKWNAQKTHIFMVNYRHGAAGVVIQKFFLCFKIKGDVKDGKMIYFKMWLNCIIKSFCFFLFLKEATWSNLVYQCSRYIYIFFFKSHRIAKLLISPRPPSSKKEIKMALFLGGCSFVVRR